MDRALASRRHGPAAPWSPHTGTGETRTLLSDPPHTELAQNVLSNTKGDLSYANSEPGAQPAAAAIPSRTPEETLEEKTQDTGPS